MENMKKHSRHIIGIPAVGGDSGRNFSKFDESCKLTDPRNPINTKWKKQRKTSSRHILFRLLRP